MKTQVPRFFGSQSDTNHEVSTIWWKFWMQLLFQKCPAQIAYLNNEKEIAGEQRIKVTFEIQTIPRQTGTWGIEPQGKAISVQAYCPAALLALWIHLPYCCLTNRRQAFCSFVISRAPTSTTCFLAQPTELLNLLILPSLMFSICLTPVPGHWWIGLLLGHSAFSFLFPGKAKNYSFVKQKCSYNIIRAWQRLPSSTVPCLTSIQLMPHKSSLGDFVLFSSQVSSNLPRSLPCEQL